MIFAFPLPDVRETSMLSGRTRTETEPSLPLEFFTRMLLPKIVTVSPCCVPGMWFMVPTKFATKVEAGLL